MFNITLALVALKESLSSLDPCKSIALMFS